VERILDSWERVQAAPPELLHEDIEWVNPPDAIETGTRLGPSGFDQAEAAWRRAYGSLEFDVERRVELDDSVGLIAIVLMQGRGSGIEVRQRMGFLFTFRDGRVARFEWSNDPEALLSEAMSMEE
jgi:ketosteroid isomerase-like protein